MHFIRIISFFKLDLNISVSKTSTFMVKYIFRIFHITNLPTINNYGNSGVDKLQIVKHNLPT